MTSKNIFISVIIPVYNCENYIENCVESILTQKGKDYEVILINDGSTDNSSNICKSIQKKCNNVFLYEQKNKGVSSARNLGIKKAKGKYITFIDSDDYIDSNYFEEVHRIIKNDNPELINFGFVSEIQNEKGKILSQDNINFKEKKYSSYNQIKEDLVELWDKHMLYNIWNKIYLKNIISENKIEFPKKNFGEDMEFNILYLEKINSFYNSEKCFYHYIKERKGSLTQKYNNDLFEIRKNEFYYFNNYFEKNKIKHDDYIEFSSRRFIERVVGCIENICSCNELTTFYKISQIKKIINDDVTRDTLKKTKPHSKKMKIILLPLRIKNTLMTYIMCKLIGIVRNLSPSIFNKLKNKR